MTTSLRCLLVEDSEGDARLVLSHLRSGGYEVAAERVETAAAMRAALDAKPWDIILSDYNLPQFSGSAALAVLQASGLDLPFIIVAGNVGEEVAVEVMRAGAHDYVMKDRLARLVPAVRRELREAIERCERKRAEAALRLQSAALAAAANAIVITRRDGIIVWVNNAFTQLTGYSLTEAVGRNPCELVKSGRQDEVFYENLWATICTGRVWRGELINRRKDGTLYPEEQTITPVRDVQGGIAHFVAIKQDLTERNAAEFMVRASRRQFQAVFEQAAVGMILAEGPRGTIRNANRCFCQMTGYTAEELCRLTSPEITHPDDRAGDESLLEQISLGQLRDFSREKRYRRKDGSYFWAKAFVAPLDPSEAKPTLRICVIEDISVRKATEDELRANRERFIRQQDALISLTGVEAGPHRDLETMLRRITETSARVLQVSRVSLWRYNADRSGIHCVDLYEPAADRHTSGFGLSAAACPAYFRALEQMEVIAVDDPERDPRTCELAESYFRPLGITSMLDAGIHVHGIVEGVLCHEQIGALRTWKPDEHTFAAALANLASLALVEAQRRAAEEALRGAELKLRTIVEHSSQLFFTHKPDNVPTYVSPRSREILDCEPEEAMRRWAEFVTDHPENAHGLALTRAAIESGRPQRPYELELRTQRGRTCWVEVRESPVVVDGRTVAIAGALTDITERKRADQALRESLREKEVLLKEVHHRVKNNLQVITSLLRLEARRSEHAPTRTTLNEMMGRIRSMALLHETLYGSTNLAQVDLAVYLAKLARQLFGSHVEHAAAVRLELNLSPVFAGLDQAIPCGLILNELLTNSLKHGFRDDGIGEVRVELATCEGRPDVQLRVTDTGRGLPPDFEAKRAHSLGLQLVSDLIRQLQGTLEISVGPGARFTMTFPIRAEPAAASAPETREDAP